GENDIEIEKEDLGEYFEIRRDKFYFKVPKNQYFFNENDCWARVYGDVAYIGISDFLQNQASDVMYVDLPAIDQEFEQFDDVGSFESVKTVLQLITPVSGKIIAVNKRLNDAPELLNQDPYREGWFVKIQLQNFEEDKELLLNGSEYFDLMKKKIEDEARKLHEV
ncbi:MAG: glycine cleavage system protein H, partial [Promethearchaeota archaeon]